MEEVLRKREAVLAAQREQLALTKSQHDQLTMELELARARRMGAAWLVRVVLSVLLIFHSYAHGSALFVCLNGWAFLSTWRALYVATPAPLAVTASAWLAIALTLKLV